MKKNFNFYVLTEIGKLDTIISDKCDDRKKSDVLCVREMPKR